MKPESTGNRSAVWVLASVTWAAACGGGGSPTAPPTGPPATAPSPAATPAPTPTPVAGPTALRSATFQSANGYTTEGQADIVRDGTTHRLEMRNNFRTSRSGAIDVRLCRETRCTASDLNLGAVRSFSGAQQYALPNDGAAYRYVVIWCRGVNLPFGFGELR